MLMRSAPAAWRHLVWTFAVVSTLALPVLMRALPPLNLPLLHAPTSVAASTTIHQPTEISPIGARLKIAGTANDIPAARDEHDQGVTNAPIVNSQSAVSLQSAVSPQSEVSPQSAIIGKSVAPMTLPWQLRLALIWMVGFIAVLVPIVIARLRLSLVARGSIPVEVGPVVEVVAAVSALYGISRRVRVLESNGAAMPMTWGFTAPVLLLPAGASDWPRWKIRNVVMHELAHTDRFDCLTQLVAQIACAVYWFNPLVWVAACRMRVERELACDDRVITAGSRPSDYANQLLDVARSLRAIPVTAHAAIAMARPSQLSGRVIAVLDPSRPRGGVSRCFRSIAGAAATLFIIPLAALAPWSVASSAPSAPSVAIPRQIAPELPASAIRASTPAIIPPMLDARASGAQTAGTPSLSSAFIGKSVEFVKAMQAPAGLVTLATPELTTTGSSPQLCWQQRSKEGEKGATSINTTDDDSRRGKRSFSVKFERGGCRMEMQIDGKFTLRPDLTDVASLESDGSFWIEEREGGSTRRLEIRPTRGGLDHVYYENGRRAEFNAEARRWLADALLALERRTAFAADTRVPMLFEQNGVRSVTDEIARLEGDYARSRYFSVLLSMGMNFDAPALTSLINQAASEITSDYYLSETLGKLSSQRYADESVWRAFAEATGRMKSDYYKSQAIGKVLANDRLSTTTLSFLLRTATTIKSDYYQSEILKGVARKYAINPQTRQYYMDALAKIGSDYYRYEVIKALDTDTEWDAGIASSIINAISEIKSDYYKSEALASLVQHGRLKGSSLDWYFNAARSIGSDYYKSAALTRMLSERPLTRETVAALLAAAPAIRSDYELSSLLTRIARSYRIDSGLRAAYEKAANSIGSDYYRGQALAALGRTSSDQ
jgi:beta-lactamase regulating signal transducer with metallopeptidase domain